MQASEFESQVEQLKIGNPFWVWTLDELRHDWVGHLFWEDAAWGLMELARQEQSLKMHNVPVRKEVAGELIIIR